jgi:hypothetical protein
MEEFLKARLDVLLTMTRLSLPDSTLLKKKLLRSLEKLEMKFPKAHIQKLYGKSLQNL